MTDAEIGRLREGKQQPESEKVKVLLQKVQALDIELSDRKEAAFRRGDEPRNRALEAGRAYQEGDGF